jgi:hypothetical protein
MQNGPPCRQARRLLEEKPSQVEQQITDLAAMRDHLRLVLKGWDDRLSATPDGKQARLARDSYKGKTERQNFSDFGQGRRCH